MNKFLLSLLFLLFLIPCQGQWTQLGDAPFETHHSNGFGFNGKGYIVKGRPDQNGLQSQNQFWEYDPQTDTWSLLNYIDAPNREFSIGDDMDGKYYFGFGIGRNDLWEFDPVANTFTELPSCPCTPRAHPALVAHKDKIYMGSGSSANGDLRDWWVFDFATQTWEQKTDIPGPVRHHPFQFGIGDEIFVGGGHRDNWIKFNIITEEWTPFDSTPEGRVAGTQFSYEGKGFVLSGDNDTHTAPPPNQFMMYDPESDEWFVLPFEENMHRWAGSSFIIDSTLYYFGGETSVGNDDGDMWKFDLSSLNCILPLELFTLSITDTTAGLFFSGSPSGPVSILQWREEGAANWTDVINPSSSYQFTGLQPCTNYEYRIGVECDPSNPTFSDIETFLTKGCGPCLDLSYCNIAEEYLANTAFIESLRIDEYENVSGNNGGYQQFISSDSVEVALGQTIDLELIAGRDGATRDGELKVWVDLNGDGELESDELLIDSEDIEDSFTGTITIPTDAVKGIARMRVIFNIYSIRNACRGSIFEDGEAEDYCITIVDEIVSNDEVLNASEISIYPNPTNGYVNIESGDELIESVAVYDINGKILFEQTGHQSMIDIADFATGMYIVKITSDQSTLVENLVKQ